MRIIGGKIGGIRLSPPTNLPVRPTTDIAKEALFNILQHDIVWDESNCLDLFCGTGNISLEMASRGALSVEAVDIHTKCIHYVNDMSKKYDLASVTTRKADVFKFIKSCKKTYDFIFADPPYDIGLLPQLPALILNNGLLNAGGTLVIEHPSLRKLVDHDCFIEIRKYGNSSFSFYKK